MAADATCFEVVGQHGQRNVANSSMEGLRESVLVGQHSCDTFSLARNSSFDDSESIKKEPGNSLAFSSVAQKKAYFEAVYKEMAKKKALEKAALAEVSSCMEGNCHMAPLEHPIQKTDMFSLVSPIKFEGINSANKELLEEDEEARVSSTADEEISKDYLANSKVGYHESDPLYTDNPKEPSNSSEPCSDGEKAGDAKESAILDKYEVIDIHPLEDSKEPPMLTKNKGNTNTLNVKSRVSQKASFLSLEASKVAYLVGNSSMKTGSKVAAKTSVSQIHKGKRAVESGVNNKKAPLIPAMLDRRHSQSGGIPRVSLAGPPQSFVHETPKRAVSVVGQTPHHESVKTNHNMVLPMQSLSMKNEELGKAESNSQNRKNGHTAIIRKLDESRKSRNSGIESKRSEQDFPDAQGPPQSIAAGKAKDNNNLQQKGIAFSLHTDARSEKRREFNSKMEAKLTAKEAEKDQAQAKTMEEAEAKIRELRKSLNFKATPMPSFYQEKNPPKKSIRKIPPTRPKSPKLGRKGGSESADDGDSIVESSQRVKTCRPHSATVEMEGGGSVRKGLRAEVLVDELITPKNEENVNASKIASLPPHKEVNGSLLSLSSGESSPRSFVNVSALENPDLAPPLADVASY